MIFEIGERTMRVTVVLGGNLRIEAGGGQSERSVELSNGASIEELVDGLGLPPQRVRLILLNGRGAIPSTPLQEGDRVAMFPPELSYNSYVSTSFRKEFVERRGTSSGKDVG